MKKKLSILVIVVLAMAFVLASCNNLTGAGDKKVTGIEITQGTLKYEYELNEVPDFSGVEAKVKYNDDTTVSVTGNDLKFGTIDTSTPGIKTLTITYETYTLELDVRVLGGTIGGGETEDKAVITGINATIATENASIFKGETFDTSLIKVNALYSDSTTQALTASDVTFSAVDTTAAGKKTVTVTYGEFTTTVEIEVVDVKSITVDTDTIKSEILVGETLDVSLLEVLVTYTNDKTEVVAVSDLTVTNIDATTAGDKALEITYRGFTTTFTVKVWGITGIEVVATSINTVLPAGNVPDLSNIVVKLVYGNGTKIDVDRAEVTTNINDLDWDAEGEKTLVVTYGAYNAEVIISSDEPTLDSIEIATYTAKIGLGQVYSTNNVTATAKYSNKTSETILAADLTISAIDTTTAGTKTLTVTYEGKTATKDVEVMPITSAVLKNVPAKVNQKETLPVANITLLVTFSDGTTATITSDKLTFGEFNTSAYGDKTLTVSYLGSTATATVHVKGVTSITIVTGTLTTALYASTTETYKTDGALINVTYSDGTVKENVDDAIFGEIDITTEGEKTLTVTYDGFTINVTILVKKIVAGSTIFGVNLPSNINSLDSYKQSYRNQTGEYVVGDDNPYKFTLQLVVLDENDNKVSTALNYTSYSLVYLVDGSTETLLEGAELAKYVSIDETKNEFDFTEEAVGKKFKLVTRPASNFLPGQETQMTRSHTVNVVNGYNIYTAKELNIITNATNSNTYGEDGQYNQLTEVTEFLATYGIVRADDLAGVVLHDNLIIKESDLPDSYIQEYTNGAGVTKKGLYDQLSVFNHHITLAAPEFSIYGNYYTISSYSIPNVGEFGYLDNQDYLSNSELFMFSVSDEVVVSEDYQNYNPDNYKTNVYNLTIRDNDPNSNVTEDNDRHKLGVIGVKTKMHTINYTNSRIEAYFISFMTDGDQQTVNLTQVDFYNAWQGHIFTWANNNVAGRNDAYHVAPNAENYRNTVINVIDSRLAKCGGPVFLSQTRLHSEDYTTQQIPANAVSRTDIVVDDKSTVYSYVTGTEAWFQAFGQEALAQMIMAMSNGFSNVSGGQVGYVSQNLIQGYYAMNLIMINMDAKSNLSLNPNISPAEIEDIDGSLTIGDQIAMNMNDDYAGSIVVNTYMNNLYYMAGQIPPIFHTSAGGTCASNGKLGSDSLVFGIETGTMDAPTANCFAGDYVTLNYLGVGVTLEFFNPTNPAAAAN